MVSERSQSMRAGRIVARAALAALLLNSRAWVESVARAKAAAGRVVGRDGLIRGRAIGELHVGDGSARPVESLIDQLLAAAPP